MLYPLIFNSLRLSYPSPFESSKPFSQSFALQPRRLGLSYTKNKKNKQKQKQKNINSEHALLTLKKNRTQSLGAAPPE